MNSQYPIPNSSFNPLNPNPSPNFSNPQFNSRAPLPSPPLQSQSQSRSQPVVSDLPNSFSSLKTLLQSSNSTLQSISSLLPAFSLSSNSLIQCPSNPNHWVPPNSLFQHSLHCPSSLDLGTFLDSLQYPKTLTSEQHLIHQNKFVQPLNDPTSDLCLSLDDYVDLGSNFFYQGCSGVVSSVDDDASRRIFNLPGVLSIECSNFVGGSDKEIDGFLGNSIKVLPSEMWVIGREIEQWSDYPNEYSYSVVRAFLCMEYLKESELLSWLIATSPRYGVVIDVAMRDHMSVLFRLCLKAMRREAALSHGSLLRNDVGDNGHKIDVKALRCKCPVAVELLRWLTSQLSILYGEMNAKSYVIAMLRQLLLNAASQASLFPVDRKMEHSSAIEQETDNGMGQSSGEVKKNEGNDKTDERMFIRSIFVYQIAAAIAALRERSLVEERIRALRNPLPLTAYQRMSEHQYISKKADEERQKRPDYRPLLEHDSLPFQRRHDQDSTKMKTREELLAEERDYKRRRMSYRGKRLKRSAKEVMRDIIEEYMEAIKQIGGIGGLVKEDAGSVSTFKNSTAHNSTNFEVAHHFTNDQQHGYRRSLDNNHEFRDKKHVDASPSRKERQNKEPYNHKHLEDEGTNRNRSSRDYYSRSPSVERKPSRSREHRSHRRNQDVLERDDDRRSKRNYSFHNMSSYNDPRSSKSSTLRSSSGRKDKRKLESPERHRWKKYENDERDESTRAEFSDRYDPSEAENLYDG